MTWSHIRQLKVYIQSYVGNGVGRVALIPTPTGINKHFIVQDIFANFCFVVSSFQFMHVYVGMRATRPTDCHLFLRSKLLLYVNYGLG